MPAVTSVTSCHRRARSSHSFSVSSTKFVVLLGAVMIVSHVVAPTNVFGAGAASSEVVITAGQSSNLVPGAPTLTGSVSNETATLGWRPSAGGGVATSYFLEAGTASGMSDVFSGNVGGQTHLTARVAAGTYFVRLRGVNAAGMGIASNEIVLRVSGPCTAGRQLGTRRGPTSA